MEAKMITLSGPNFIYLFTGGQPVLDLRLQYLVRWVSNHFPILTAVLTCLDISPNKVFFVIHVHKAGIFLQVGNSSQTLWVLSRLPHSAPEPFSLPCTLDLLLKSSLSLVTSLWALFSLHLHLFISLFPLHTYLDSPPYLSPLIVTRKL